MSDRIRFHLDENVNPVIALALRSYGIDVTTTIEANLRTSSDETHLAYGQQENRVIVTHDDDFLRLATAPARSSASVKPRPAAAWRPRHAAYFVI